jgi:hypothetical protein
MPADNSNIRPQCEKVAAPTADELREFAKLHGRSAPAKLRKQFPAYSPSTLVAMLNVAAPDWSARPPVKHSLQAHPNPVSKAKGAGK